MIRVILAEIHRMKDNPGSIYVLPNGRQLIVSDANGTINVMSAGYIDFNAMDDAELHAWVVKNAK